MAAGMAVIVTETSAAGIVDGNGQLVPPRDPSALAAAIERYLGDPGAAGHASAPLARAGPGRSWEAVAADHVGRFRRAMLASGSARRGPARRPSQRGLRRDQVHEAAGAASTGRARPAARRSSRRQDAPRPAQRVTRPARRRGGSPGMRPPVPRGPGRAAAPPRPGRGLRHERSRGEHRDQRAAGRRRRCRAWLPSSGPGHAAEDEDPRRADRRGIVGQELATSGPMARAAAASSSDSIQAIASSSRSMSSTQAVARRAARHGRRRGTRPCGRRARRPHRCWRPTPRRHTGPAPRRRRTAATISRSRLPTRRLHQPGQRHRQADPDHRCGSAATTSRSASAPGRRIMATPPA